MRSRNLVLLVFGAIYVALGILHWALALQPLPLALTEDHRAFEQTIKLVMKIEGSIFIAYGAVLVTLAAPWKKPTEGDWLSRNDHVVRALVSWSTFVLLLVLIGSAAYEYIRWLTFGETIEWRTPRALWLVFGGGFAGVLAFHLHRRRAGTMAFSQTALLSEPGALSYFADLPGVLRSLVVVCLAVALARPETYRTVKHDVDSIDIMIVFDMSKSMEEPDMPRDRMDAAQRVVRRFLRRNKNDRIGLVIFGQSAMLQCPLTQDTKLLEQIVADLVINDVPPLGTAIGDGLALGLAQLKRSDAKSKVVILLSDGDSNWVAQFPDGTRGFYPDEAARVAQQAGVKVYTVLVGKEESDFFGGMSVNPATLRDIAATTGGDFFRATDYESFDRGFQTVRNKLDTTKRTVTERVPDLQLFVPFVELAGLLLALELLLSYTRFRRLP